MSEKQGAPLGAKGMTKVVKATSQLFLHARHCAKHFTRVISLNPYSNPMVGALSLSPVTDEEIEAQGD